MVVFPMLEALLRPFGSGVSGASLVVQHLTLWVCFLGSALAARQGRLISFATREILTEGRRAAFARVAAASVAAAVSALLFVGGIDLVRFERESTNFVTSWLPTWVAQIVLPFAFALIALRIVWRVGEVGRWARVVAGGAMIAGALAGSFPSALEAFPSWPLVTLVLVATLLGGPIFAALGGIAAVLFLTEGVPPVAVLLETYSLTVSPTLPSIPLFTLVGFLLAEGNASSRLLRAFRAFFGSISGGTAIVCALVCAFFTIPTGGSGVTILALGGLLYQALRQDGYGDRFSLGLLTGSGSLGLLFAPALPLILYGIVAQVPIEDLFVAGVLPGLLMVGLVALWGMRAGRRYAVPRHPFRAAEARAALWEAKWELLLPVVALGAVFSGYATLVEAAAITVVYTLVTQGLVHRELPVRTRLPHAIVECIVLVGGVLLILGMARGFNSYLVDAQIPSRALELVTGSITSPLVFLLCLNVFLLLVGTVMDIFSATIVVVPLIEPLSRAFGIDPIHLGIIFIANLELGYLTPPVGLNLFFASYRFEKPLLEVYRAAVPMLLILAVGVVLITYVPALSTLLLEILGRR